MLTPRLCSYWMPYEEAVSDAIEAAYTAFPIRLVAWSFVIDFTQLLQASDGGHRHIARFVGGKLELGEEEFLGCRECGGPARKYFHDLEVKVQFAPQPGISIGRIATRIVESSPLFNRGVASLQAGARSSRAFRLMQWNVLYSMFADASDDCCPKQFLDRNHRTELILHYIQKYNPDLLPLQELDPPGTPLHQKFWRSAARLCAAPSAATSPPVESLGGGTCSHQRGRTWHVCSLRTTTPASAPQTVEWE